MQKIDKKKDEPYNNLNNVAICSIDGSFTNELEMPEFPQEKGMIHSLWLFTERKGA